MKRIIAFIMVMLCFVLTACSDGLTAIYIGDGNKKTDAEKLPVRMINDDWGIKMWADEITPRGITLHCEQFGGNHTGELQTGAAYLLEVWEEDKWKPVKHKIEAEPVWNAMAYKIIPNDITSWNINFEFIYDELKAGRYRVGKEIMDFREAGNYDRKKYYAEFTIE